MRFSGGEEGGGCGSVVVAGAPEVGVGEEKGVKCSAIGTMGKRAVQNVYFSNGVEVGKGESMMRDVEWRVHYVKLPAHPLSAPPPPTGVESNHQHTCPNGKLKIVRKVIKRDRSREGGS